MWNALLAIHPPLLIGLASVAAALASGFMPLLAVSAVLAADVVGRARDYAYLRRQPAGYFTPKIVERFGRSWCGRSVMAAVNPETRGVYAAAGYRWFHLLPDGALTADSPFLRARFWRNLAVGHSKAANDNEERKAA